MKTILIADDDIVTRKVMRNICETLGYKVIESSNGSEALKVLQRERVEILISDWMMPKMDGVALCEKIRTENQVVRTNPFIFLLTGKKKGVGNYSRALDAGADDLLYKPVDYFVFRNQLRAAEKSLELANE